MILESIADYLEEKRYGREGEGLFIWHMPDDIKEGILLIDSIVGTRINHELTGYRKGKFQVIIRTQDYTEGYELISRISDSLTILDADMKTVIVKYIRPRTDPIVFPISKGDNLEMTVVFDTAYILK